MRQCSISLSALITGIHHTFIWRPPSSWLLMDLMINLAIYNYDGNTWSLVDNDTPFVVFMISPFSNSVQALFMTHTEANRWADYEKSHKVCLVSGFGARASQGRGQAPSISGERWTVPWTRATWLNIGERSNTWGPRGVTCHVIHIMSLTPDTISAVRAISLHHTPITMI